MKGVSIEERATELAHYIIDSKDTVRGAAKKFGISKSTVHKDLHDRLKILDDIVYDKVNKIMQKHIQIRHIRGGESTRKKYQKIEKLNNLSTNIK